MTENAHTINEPKIRSLSVVAENILLLTVQQGQVTGGVQIPYIAQSGETLEQDRDIPALVYIVKDGKRIGVKVEDRQKGTQRFPFEQLVSKELDTRAADDPATYRLNGVRPLRVYRKTKPNNIADPEGGYTFLHRIYLVFEEPFVPGQSLALRLAPGVFDREKMTAVFDASSLMSEAIQVSQVGYRPDDPGKKAYLSQWMGLGGGVSYDGIRRFCLLNEQNERVFSGDVCLQHTGGITPVGNGEVSSVPGLRNGLLGIPRKRRFPGHDPGDWLLFPIPHRRRKHLALRFPRLHERPVLSAQRHRDREALF